MGKVTLVKGADFLEWDDVNGKWIDGGQFDKWNVLKDLHTALCLVAQKRSILFAKCECCFHRKNAKMKGGRLCLNCGFDKVIDESIEDYRKSYQDGTLYWQDTSVTFEEYCIGKHKGFQKDFS